MNTKTARVIDANLNRATEGLRVVEDILRFVYDDAILQQQLKAMRHRLVQAVPGAPFLAVRDAAGDVGRDAQGALEYERRDLAGILRANLKRVQEALRVLEEILKLEQSAAEPIKALRYEAYELEGLMAGYLTRTALRPGLYLVLTDPRDGYERLTQWAVEAGLPVVQLRYKGRDEREHLALARTMRRITRGSDTRFIVNDRADIAVMVDADGLHLGQDDLPPAEVRRLIGPDMLLGLSTHNLEQVAAANDLPVDYIGFGPLYPTNSKAKPDPVTGPEALKTAHGISRHPIVAIGGLDLERITGLGASAHNVAVIRAVSEAAEPLLAMRTIQAHYLEEL